MNPVPLLAASATMAFGAGLQPSDLLKLRAVGTVRLSPDGSRIAYTMVRNDGSGRPFPQVWILSIPDGKTIPLESGQEISNEPVWSHDSKRLAYIGTHQEKQGLILVDAEGAGKRFLAAMDTTNTPLPNMGNKIAWSPDDKRIAYVSALPGPDGDRGGDPIVITRRFYKPADKQTGDARFRDEKHLHIFVAEVETGQSKQLTSGTHDEHSIDWSPTADEIAFVSNPEPGGDAFFNYDLFTVHAGTGATSRLAASENAEYRPQWSPDGKMLAYEATKRGFTGLEFTMENTHIWLVNADGSNRRELGGSVDNRQHEPAWAPDGKSVLFSTEERGNMVLYRVPVGGGDAVPVSDRNAQVCSWSLQGDKLAFALEGPGDKAQLYLKTADAPARQLTALNRDVLSGKQIAKVEPLTFISNDNKWNVEAFLTYPVNFQPDRRYPLVVVIHGGPHFQQGAAFDFKNQVYAAFGFATLMVNYRGSIGYGQAFTDAVFRDQNGNEAQDILYGVSAALRRHQWIDRDRIGIEGVSYGGQLTAWLITQTNMFKSAIPTAAVINILSFNYTTNYHQYEQMQWGLLPHQGNLMDTLWELSPLKHVAKAHTPTMLVHGESDFDVPIGESEQFYMALRDVGTDAILVRYPGEGHGIHGSKHAVDCIERSLAWHQKYFR